MSVLNATEPASRRTKTRASRPTSPVSAATERGKSSKGLDSEDRDASKRLETLRGELQVYRVTVTQPDNYALGYRYDKEEEAFHSLIEIPTQFQDNNLITQDDLIKAWIKKGEEAFSASSSLNVTLWAGHIEQFARVMLQLSNLIYYGKDWAGNDRWLYKECVLRAERAGPYFEGGFGLDAEPHYRAWLSLLGCRVEDEIDAMMGQDGVTVSYIRLCLNVALQDFNSMLKHRKPGSDISSSPR
jgi:hypothetical protein